MIEFWHAIPSRAATVRWMLEEVGAPYTVHLLDLAAGEQNAPAYRAVNPMGKVPAIRHRGMVVTEAAAICAYLADAFPEAGLAPPPGDPARGPWYRWILFAPSVLELAMLDVALKREPGPRGMVGHGDFATVMDVLAGALAGSAHICGDRFSAADVVLGSTLRWGMRFGIVPERPEFLAYAARLSARPALQRAEALDAEARR